MSRPIRGAAALALIAALTAPALAAPRKAAPAPAPAEAAQPPASQPVPALTPAEIVRRANAFLNGVDFLSSSFSQTSGDGRRSTGRFYLSRPGRLRFDYDPPAALEVVSDGGNVVVRDRKLNTSNAYPAGQTPLRFLLQENIDLGRDLKLIAAQGNAQGAYVAFESGSDLVGNSRIALYFDETVTRLLQWRVIDAQNQQTTVTLGPLDRTPIDDVRLFDVRFQSVR